MRKRTRVLFVPALGAMLIFGLVFAACGDDDDDDDALDGLNGDETTTPIGGDGDETPEGETPEGETPEGETPEGETPEGETPEGTGTPDDTEGSDAPGGNTVTISDGSFDPSTLDVSQGDTVTFENEGTESITINISGGDTDESQDIEGGDSYDHTFDETGTFTVSSEDDPTAMTLITVS